MHITRSEYPLPRYEHIVENRNGVAFIEAAAQGSIIAAATCVIWLAAQTWAAYIITSPKKWIVSHVWLQF